MNTIDFEKLAEEYEEQAAVLELKIQKRRAQLSDRSIPLELRIQAERALPSLLQMKFECEYNARKMRNWADLAAKGQQQ